MASLVNSTKHLKKNEHQLPYKLLQNKVEKEGKFPNSFFEASIKCMWKSARDNTRKLQVNISSEYRWKVF